MVNSFSSQTAELHDAGLPQGSPLSPILFLFFDADLVEQKIDFNGGSVAFIDDYTTWITGHSAEENTRKFQTEILPRLETWRKESGAIFEASKTELFHFTRNLNKGSQTPLTMDNASIIPKTEVKLLEVILDRKLTFKDHVVEKAAYKGTVAALALKRLKGLRPKAVRQLFTSTVTSVSNYASSVWLSSISEKTRALFDRIQRIGAQAILGIFKSVALPIAEAEASLIPVKLRHQHQLAWFWINYHTLPKDHPLWRVQKRVKLTHRFCSPLAKGIANLKLNSLENMEEIQSHCLPPEYSRLDIRIEKDREKAIALAENIKGIKLGVDCSGRNNLIVVGASYGSDGGFEQHLTVGSSQSMNVFLGELTPYFGQ